MPIRFTWENLARAAALGLLAYAASAALLRARAGCLVRANTLDAARAAAAADPANADLHLWLAEHLDHAGADPTPALDTAIALRPLDSAARIRRGLFLESAGNSTDAETSLLQAAQIDRTWTPRWTLANFYFRRNDEQRFWHWVEQALPMAHGDPQPLWRLCWQFPGSDSRTAALLDRRPDLRASWLDFLERQPEPRALDAAATVRLPADSPRNRDRLLRWSTRLIEGGRPGAARDLWNSLAAAGAVAANDNTFEKAPAGNGFGWRVNVPFTHLRPGIQLRFDGKQDEQMEAAWRYVDGAATGAVTPDWDAPPDSGFSWHAEPTATPGVSRLSLRYARPLGSPRFAGALRIRRVTLEPPGR
jgi:hypothetical protein